jgi:hypothetical protein
VATVASGPTAKTVVRLLCGTELATSGHRLQRAWGAVIKSGPSVRVPESLLLRMPSFTYDGAIYAANLLLDLPTVVLGVSSIHSGREASEAVPAIYVAADSSLAAASPCDAARVATGNVFVFGSEDSKQTIQVQLNTAADIQLVGAVVAVESSSSSSSGGSAVNPVWDYFSVSYAYQLSSGKSSGLHSFGTIGWADNTTDIRNELLQIKPILTHVGNVIQWSFGPGYESSDGGKAQGSLVCGLFAFGEWRGTRSAGVLTDSGSSNATGTVGVEAGVSAGVVAVAVAVAVALVVYFCACRNRRGGARKGFYTVSEMVATRADQIVDRLNMTASSMRLVVRWWALCEVMMRELRVW